MAQNQSDIWSAFFVILDRECSNMKNPFGVRAYIAAVYFRELKKHSISASQVYEAWQRHRKDRLS
jgi:hypothetical protein